MNSPQAGHAPIKPSRKAALILGALGVVYGDIGTSPLYTMKEVFAGAHPLAIDARNVMGILSLVFWSLILVVSVKYVGFVLRANNQGEGGIMALMALMQRATERRPGLARWLLPLGLFGAALFYGDGMITPAISVLSAVEGLEVASSVFAPFVEPLSLGVLIALFVLQSRGTGHMGRLFGPVMLAWFATLATLGLLNIGRHVAVLQALNPQFALDFMRAHGHYGFLALGGVVLAVTGAEALYADMGHFGRKPIQTAWFSLVLPALALNYFGQGALLLTDAQSIGNPFYSMAPLWMLYPLVTLATAATIIASQAVITGAFSMTREAIQLGYLPRMAILHTSEQEKGQIYIPFINWALLVGIVFLILGFQTSSHLAAAYGIAVTGTMAITSILGFVVVTLLWRWNPWLTTLGLVVFLAADLAFLGANLVKLLQGGWFPLVVGGVVFTLLATWKRGRELLRRQTQADAIPLDAFLRALAEQPPTRVPGTAVFLSTHADIVPRALLHNLAHNKVLHARNVFVTVVTENQPYVPVERRTEVTELAPDCFRTVVHYGFMQIPNIPRALARCQVCGREFNMLETSFFFSRETILPSKLPGMALWREALFAWMARNAQGAMAFFRIPPNRVIELGSQVQL